MPNKIVTFSLAKEFLGLFKPSLPKPVEPVVGAKLCSGSTRDFESLSLGSTLSLAITLPPFYQDNLVTVFNSSCRSMAGLEDESVQCVVTSPPYWGLRKYAGEQDLVWGGEKDCPHQWGMPKPKKFNTVQGGEAQRPHNFIMEQDYTQGSFCSLCGAWQGGFGLEPTPELYVQHTVEILREIRRVLRKDGVVWWNIGDSYFANQLSNRNFLYEDGRKANNPDLGRVTSDTLKPKDLCLIPFRVAIAAQEDSWFVRSVIIWNKTNPMPESVKDRPTESHEYILMLTKSARYYYDQEAVREGNADPDRTNFVSGSRIHGLNLDRNDNDLGERSKGFIANGRNLRSVWTFSTQPFKGAHFATYPEALPERCIKAGTPEVGCCAKCGAPWVRVTKRIGANSSDEAAIKKLEAKGVPRTTANLYATKDRGYCETLGWRPSCSCGVEDKVPSVVLDPFAGSGTTLQVARSLGRRSVGYEISTEYCQLIAQRVNAKTREEKNKE